MRSALRCQAGIGLVEVLIALIILSVGMLSIAGISLSVGAQTQWAAWQTDQSLAAQTVLERVQREGYDAADNGTDTVVIGTKTYLVNRTVTEVEPRVKEVQATVSGVHVSPRTFVTRVYKERPLPTPPEQ